MGNIFIAQLLDGFLKTRNGAGIQRLDFLAPGTEYMMVVVGMSRQFKSGESIPKAGGLHQSDFLQFLQTSINRNIMVDTGILLIAALYQFIDGEQFMMAREGA